jgi:hypothetical protein
MAQHKLNLYIPEQTDARVMDIFDISLYDSNLSITNASLKVNIPGSDCDFFPIFTVKGRTFLTSNSFGITNTFCSTGLNDLQDGIYTFTYSVCPNDTVYYTTKYLRTKVTENTILNLMSSIMTVPENTTQYNIYGTDVTDQKLIQLNNLYNLLQQAKVDVLFLRFTEAEDKFTYINNQLNNF